MSDLESQVQSTKKIKENFTINLFLRTVFHVVYCVWFLFVLSWGCMIWFSITEEQMQHPILRGLKVLTPFFFTNWNFTVFHGVAFATMASVSMYGVLIIIGIKDDGKTPVIIVDTKQYALGFLTNWNLTFQTIFLALSLAHDVLEWLDKQKSNLGAKIKYWRDVIFCGMVVPFTLFVTGMFWTVYAIDRELVFPKIYDEVVPWWFNHCVHTNITVVLLVETLLQARRHPTNKKLELILYWVVAFAYAVVYYTIYFVTDRWLYQVFGVMNWWQVCLYQLFIWGISYVFYIMQFPVNRLIHGADVEPIAENNEEKHNINGAINENDRPTDILNPDEKVNEDFETSLPEKSWSLKFRSLKSDVENSRL